MIFLIKAYFWVSLKFGVTYCTVVRGWQLHSHTLYILDYICILLGSTKQTLILHLHTQQQHKKSITIFSFSVDLFCSCWTIFCHIVRLWSKYQSDQIFTNFFMNPTFENPFNNPTSYLVKAGFWENPLLKKPRFY